MAGCHVVAQTQGYHLLCIWVAWLNSREWGCCKDYVFVLECGFAEFLYLGLPLSFKAQCLPQIKEGLSRTKTLTFLLRHYELTNENVSYFLTNQSKTKTFIDLRRRENNKKCGGGGKTMKMRRRGRRRRRENIKIVKLWRRK